MLTVGQKNLQYQVPSVFQKKEADLVLADKDETLNSQGLILVPDSLIIQVPPMGLFYPMLLVPDVYPPPPRSW